MSKEKAARMAGEWWACRLQQGDRCHFATEVETRVLARLQTEEIIILTCDYDPWGILLDAVRAIGLPCHGRAFSARGILPQKHELVVSAAFLKGKEGYGNWTDPIPVED